MTDKSQSVLVHVQCFGSQLHLSLGLEKRKEQLSPVGVKNRIMLHSVAKNALLGIFSLIPPSSQHLAPHKSEPLSPGVVV